MVLSWLIAATAAGATVLTPLAVEEIERTAAGRAATALTPLAVEEILVGNGAVIGVSTERGVIRTPCVVAATGAWARDLLDPLGVAVPVERRRLNMALLQQRRGARALHTCVTDGNSNLVIRPGMGRHVLAVAYPPEMPAADDPLAEASTDEHRDHADRISRATAERLPSMAIAATVSTTSGAYDITPDYHPILGWADEIAPVSGLYLAVGLSGHGLKLSPALGEIAAAAVLGVDNVGRAPPIDVAALRPSRFARGELMHLTYGPSARA